MVGDASKGGFRDISLYKTQIGTIQVFINHSKNIEEPTFSSPQVVEVDERPIKTYVHPYPLYFDYDQDGMKDLLVGTHEGKITVYLQLGNIFTTKVCRWIFNDG